MATVPYPSVALPGPSRTSYGKEYRSKLRRVKMDDGGPGRTRREYYAQAFDMTLTFNFTSEQLSIFEAFIKFQCVYGTQWFECPIYPGKDNVTVRLTSGAPKVTAGDFDWEVVIAVMAIEPGIPAPSLVTMPLWPTSLPLPEKENFSYQLENEFLEGNMDAGLQGSRARFTNKHTVFTCGWRLTSAERDIFWSFVRTDLLDGAAPFMMWFWNGEGVNLVKCKFVNLPKESEDGQLYKIECSLGTTYAPGMLYSDYLEIIYQGYVSDYADDYFLEDYTELVPA